MILLVKLLFSALLALGVIVFTPPGGAYQYHLGRNIVTVALLLLLMSLWAPRGFVIMMTVLLGGGLVAWWFRDRKYKKRQQSSHASVRKPV